MAEIIAPERAARAAGPGLSYWLGTKVLNQPLAMEAGAAARLQAAIKDKAFDAPLGALPVASRFVGTKAGASGYRVTDDGIAILPVHGVLIDRGEWLGERDGWCTSYEGLAEQVRRVLKDDAITAVLLDMDSGGGMVAGLFDLCDQLAGVRRKRKLFAVAANMACSAAYAIGCVADELYVTQSAQTGSIGVISMHMSYAEMLSQMGLEPTIIHAGAHKPNGNPYQALSHNARAEMSGQCDAIYADFVAHVARQRNVDPEAVRATEARVYLGDKAVAAKLADGVKSFDEVLAHIRAARSKGGRPRGPSPSKSQSASSSAAHGGSGMSGQTPSGDRPDVNAMIEAYTAGIRAAGAQPQPQASQPALAPVAQPATPVQQAAARTTPEADARARVKAILSCEAAKTRPALAQHLALETDMSSEAAEAVLKASASEAKPEAQPANPLAAAMRQPGTSAGVRPDGAPQSNGTSVTAGMPSLADKVGTAFGAKKSNRRS